VNGCIAEVSHSREILGVHLPPTYHHRFTADFTLVLGLVLQTYLRVEGVKSLSYSATGESPITGGASTQALEEELTKQVGFGF
jgi:hypothetical protein